MNNSQKTHKISLFRSTFLYIISFLVCDHGSLGKEGQQITLRGKKVELRQQAQVLSLQKDHCGEENSSTMQTVTLALYIKVKMSLCNEN